MKKTTRSLRLFIRWGLSAIIVILDYLYYLYQMFQYPKKRTQLIKRGLLAGVVIFLGAQAWRLFKPTETIEIKHRIDSIFFQELMTETLPFQLKDINSTERTFLG